MIKFFKRRNSKLILIISVFVLASLCFHYEYKINETISFYKTLVAKKDSEIFKHVATAVSMEEPQGKNQIVSIATWVYFFVNQSGPSSQNPLITLATRTGACAGKSVLLKSLLEAIGYKVRLFNLFNFGCVGCGHTALEVQIDNKWSFFDPTYGGYFEKKDKILSFEEMMNEYDKLTKYLVPIPSEMKGFNQGHKSKNTNRMLTEYSREKLKNYRSYGPVVEGGKIPLIATFDLLNRKHFSLGGIDNSELDVESDGRNLKISEQMSNFLYNRRSAFKPTWELRNILLNSEIEIEMRFVKTSGRKIKISLKVENAQIKNGESFDGNKNQVWKIQIVPTGKLVNIHFNFERLNLYEGLLLDSMDLKVIN